MTGAPAPERPPPDVPLPRIGQSVLGTVPPPTVQGFDHVQRFFDPTRNQVMAKILPGEFYVSRGDEWIATVLGSCVTACIRDPEAGIGGMNHFMIPNVAPIGSGGGPPAEIEAARYGMYAMEFLINTILTNGGLRDRLQVKLVGGGHVLRGSLSIGRENVAFAREYVAAEGLDLVGEHVEGFAGRRVLFHPVTGESLVLELPTTDVEPVRRREDAYARTIIDESGPGDVELF